MKTIEVALGSRSYPIHIGAGILDKSELYQPHIRGSKAVVITNETIAPLYAQNVVDSVGKFAEVHTHVLADGEIHKNLQTIGKIFDKLLNIPCDRKTTIIALGGGVVGDTAGFAAACYQRGVPFIQVPTTLLAQVDSSVGGKTGVNHPLGKNMIGAFYQPQCVIADTNTLHSLPDRELRAGLAEVIKYGAIQDARFFAWLDENIDSILEREPASLAHAIEVSCRSKAEVVAKDERETGIRAILNFGHTFGHAIETWLNYKKWLHGEAVAVGMVMAADLSRRLNLLSAHQASQVEQIIKRTGLPVLPPVGMSTTDFLEAMSLDKKVQGKTIRIIVLDGIGKAEIKDDYDFAELKNTLDAFTSR